MTPTKDKNDEDETPQVEKARGPTLDEAEQGERAIALIDHLYDAAQDEVMDEEGGPITPAARRHAEAARRMVDDLPRHIVAYHQAKAERAARAATGDGQPLDPFEAATLDTARLRTMTRSQLEILVNRLRSVRGHAPVATFDGVTDEELQEMARGLRPTPRAPP